MAGTTQKVKRNWLKTTALHIADAVLDPLFAFYTQHNNVITDLETLRVGIKETVQVANEELAAGVDISARPFYQAKVAETVLDTVIYIPQGNSAGIDGSNTLVITLRNITEGANIATITRTTDLVSGTPIALTLDATKADIAAGDVLGLTITQGAAADITTGVLQFQVQKQTIDAAADLVASALTDSL